MSESFLYYVWQCQYFDRQALQTTSGEPLQIIHAGLRNAHAGPDFHMVRIRIGELVWAGFAEMHVRASEWYEHHHQHDDAYDAVVLHVVWTDDKPVMRRDGSPLPTLELKNRVDLALATNYKNLVDRPDEVPCAPQLADVPASILYSMLDKAMATRLERKAEAVNTLLRRNRGDWEETTYQVVAQNFGFKINADPFLQLAQLLPYRILRKHADQPAAIEALLLGMAGFLPASDPDDYTMLLMREFKLLAHKYALHGTAMNRAQWRFLRLRPANFPTVRLVQLAAVLRAQPNLFASITGAADRGSLAAIFSAAPAAYWQHHYRPSKPSPIGATALGEHSLDALLINSVAPLWVCYGRTKDDQSFIDRAWELLHTLSPENNAIVRRWQMLDVPCNSAFDSQALLELYNGFCSKRRCLDCNIGASLLKPAKKE